MRELLDQVYAGITKREHVERIEKEIEKLAAIKAEVDSIDPMRLCIHEQKRRRRAENRSIDLYALRSNIKHNRDWWVPV